MTRQTGPGYLTGIALLLPITLTTMAVVLLTPIVPNLMAQFSAVPGHAYWVPMILTVPALCSAAQAAAVFAGALCGAGRGAGAAD
jgi:uncharacterized membrane protein